MISSNGTEDDELRHRANRRHRLLAVVPLVPAVLILVGIGVFLMVSEDGPWWTIPVLLLPTLIPAGAILLTFRLQRRGHRWFPPPIRLFGADRATQRRIRRAVLRGRLPAEEPDRGLALEMVEATERARWARWLVALMSVLALILIFTADEWWIRAMLVFVFVTSAPAAAWTWWTYSRVHAIAQAQGLTVRGGQPDTSTDRSG